MTGNLLLIFGLFFVSVGLSLLGEPFHGTQYFRAFAMLINGVIFGTVVGRHLMKP